MFNQPAPYRPAGAMQSKVASPPQAKPGYSPAPASGGMGQPPNFQNRPNMGQFGAGAPSMGPAQQPMSNVAQPNTMTGTAGPSIPPSASPAIEPNTAGARMQGPSPSMGMQQQPATPMGGGLPAPSYPVMNKRPTGA